MTFITGWDWSLDGWIVLAGILCAVAASLLGNFLILRRLSMLGDAITHAVLPGLAVAFFISESRSSLPMFVGAVIVGVLTALFTEWIRRIGKVDEGASMGVVFTSLFALGLVLIVQAADHVDLDASCVLYGAIELTPLDTVRIMERDIPRAVIVLGVVATINLLFVLLFFKELKLTSFDPALATSSGFNASLIHYSLMVLVAVTAVASFESVGNILVVAMFVAPPAAAYLLTNRLAVMILFSCLIAAASAALGHLSALVVPQWFGYRSTTTAGMIAVCAGGFLFLAATISPQQGIIVKLIRRRILSAMILADDVIALLYRTNERGSDSSMSIHELQETLLANKYSLKLVLGWLQRKSKIELANDQVLLTEKGISAAEQLVRSHRLWEQYLSDHADVDMEKLHDKAERFEHFTDQWLREQLNQATDSPQIDPHGTPIPAERDNS